MEQAQTTKDKAINGMLWSFVERFGFLSIQFISNIVLARLLMPEDFGLIGMLMVFFAISAVLVDGGMGTALIQKKSPTQNDYSTIFFINIFIASILYLLIFIFSPYIAIFFSQPQLSVLLKVVGLIMIFDSFSIVQNNILIKNLDFKKITRVKITAVSISSTVAIICAFAGLGVWSLAIQLLLNSSIKSLLFWLYTNWKPSKIISKNSFNELFGFGSKLLMASLLSELYLNFQSILIGRYFSATNLGYYTQAKQLQNIPVTTFVTVVNQVSLPVFAKQQDELNVLKGSVMKILKSLVYVIFPLMVLLTIIAKPLFVLLFSVKWLPSVPYFQLLCMGFGLLLIVHNTNLNVLKSVGRSDLVLYLEIVKKITGVILVVLGIQYGITGMIIGLAINSYLEFFLNGYFTGKTIKYGIFSQLRDILPALILSLVVGGITYYCFNYFLVINSNVLLLMAQVFLFLSLYILGSYLVKFEALNIYYSIIRSKFFKKKA